MSKRIATWGAVAAMGVLGALAISTPAQAQSGPIINVAWSANGESSIVDHDTVRLQGDNTSVETAALGVNVDAGAEISFKYELFDGAQCTGGAPRVFVIINGVNTNSWDQLQPTGQQCGTDGLVTFTAGNAGLITTAGIVYDNSSGGVVEVSNLTVAGEPVLFQAPPEPSPSPSPSPTTSPSPEPTASPTTDPEPTAEPTGPADKPGLPVTGSKLAWLVGGGLGLLATGAGAVSLTRLRRLRLR